MARGSRLLRCWQGMDRCIYIRTHIDGGRGFITPQCNCNSLIFNATAPPQIQKLAWAKSAIRSLDSHACITQT